MCYNIITDGGDNMGFTEALKQVKFNTEREVRLMGEALSEGFMGMANYMMSRDVNADNWNKEELEEKFNVRYKHFKARLRHLERDFK